MLVIRDYTEIFKAESKDGDAIPGETELSYGAFVSELIKVANLQYLMEQNAKGKPASQVVYKEYGEYEMAD